MKLTDFLKINAGGPPSSKGPGSGNYNHMKRKHDVIVYHGTDQKRIASILKDGLKHDAPKNFKMSRGAVYATERLDLAQRFAAEDQVPLFGGMSLGWKEGVVLKLALSKNEYSKFEVDPDWSEPKRSTATMYRGTIKPEHIVGVSQFNIDDETWTDFVPPDKIKINATKDMVTLYVPYFGGIDDVLKFIGVK